MVIKKKIAFISHSAEMFGAPRVLLIFLERIDTEKFDPIVVCYGDGEFVDHIKRMGIKYYVIYKDILPNSQIFKRIRCGKCKKVINIILLAFYLFKNRIEIVYINTISRSSPVIASRLLNLKMIMHVHEYDKFFKAEDYFHRSRLEVKLNWPDYFICVSNATRRLLLERGIPNGKTIVIHNSVDHTRFKHSEEVNRELREQFNIPSTCVVVGFVGNLSYRKGIDEFLRIAALLSKGTNNCHFVVVGGDLQSEFYTKKVMPMVEELKLNDRVTFTGYHSDVKPYYSIIDIFAMTSREEPFALVNLEASSSGKPIVATKIGGNPEAIIDGQNGFLVPLGDREMFVNKLRMLMENKKLREQFGQNGRSMIKQDFDVGQYVQNLTVIIDNLIQRSFH